MSSDEVNDVKNEQATETIANEINEEVTQEANDEQIKETAEEPPKEDASPEVRELRDNKEETQPIAKATTTPEKLARTLKVVELVECSACNKKCSQNH